MKAALSVRKAILVCTTVLLGLTFTSWKQGTPDPSKNNQDTVPPKQQKKIVDLDDALNELDGAKADLENTIKDIDWDKMNADLKESMKSLDVDMKKMNQDLKKSLATIDVEKMRLDVEASVAKIDWEGIKVEIEKAKNINLDDVKANMEKVKVNMQKLKPELEKNLQEARKNIDKAKSELHEYKRFEDGLERDDLINKKDGYKIEHRNGQLLINGKPQSSEVYNRYKAFLEKNKTFTLKKSLDDFEMDKD